MYMVVGRSGKYWFVGVARVWLGCCFCGWSSILVVCYSWYGLTCGGCGLRQSPR